MSFYKNETFFAYLNNVQARYYFGRKGAVGIIVVGRWFCVNDVEVLVLVGFVITCFFLTELALKVCIRVVINARLHLSNKRLLVKVC